MHSPGVLGSEGRRIRSSSPAWVLYESCLKRPKDNKERDSIRILASSAVTVSGWWMVLTDFLAMELTGISILTSFCTSHMDWFAFSG